MNRRTFLLAGTSTAAVLVVAACGSTTASSDLAKAASVITTLSGVLTAFEPALAAIPVAGPFVALALQYAPTLAGLATKLAASNGPATVTSVETDINAVVTAAKPILAQMPASSQQAITDMQIALPVLEAAVSGLAAASPAGDAAIVRLQAFAAGGRH
jgi:hypothetical protein